MAAGGPGSGAEFWQYRPAHSGDEARRHRLAPLGPVGRAIRARTGMAGGAVGDALGRRCASRWASPRTSGCRPRPTAPRCWRWRWRSLLVRGGERVGLADWAPRRAPGEVQLYADRRGAVRRRRGRRICACRRCAALPAHARALFFSDFLGDPRRCATALTARRRPWRAGHVLMVLDPQEEAFPFDGRTIFESIGRQRCATRPRRPAICATAICDRLAERKDALAAAGAADRLAVLGAITPTSRRRRRCCGCTARIGGPR